MSDLGAPSINISFVEKGKTAIKRGSQGIVLLGVKDNFAVPLNNTLTVTSVGDIPATLKDTTKEQIKLALIGYQTAPIKVLVYGMNIEDDADADAISTAYTKSMKAWETIKFDYLAIPTVSTDGQTTTVVTWIKSMRAKKKQVKAVLPNTAADCEYIINYAIDKNVYTEQVTQNDGSVKSVDTTYTAEQYCSRIAGLICGTPLKISATYAPLSELTDCTRLDDLDGAVNAGKFVIFHDGEKVKTCRAVNSFVTTTQDKGDKYKKIKIIDIMDLITDDITKTVQDSYLGKYANSYDNKCGLIAAIKGYFMQLERDGLITKEYVVDFDIDALKAYHLSKGIYTEEQLAAMSDDEIARLDTGSKVFLKAGVVILDAMEDLDLPIAI